MAKLKVEKIQQERRFKLAYVTGDAVLGWFTYNIGEPVSNERTYIKGVPKHTVVLGVDYETQHGAFVFLLGNMNFAPVPMGEYPPTLNIYTKVVLDEKSNDSV